MSEHAGGMFIVQCAHWMIPLSDFPVPRKGKSDASESLHLRRNRIAILTKVAILLYFLWYGHIKRESEVTEGCLFMQSPVHEKANLLFCMYFL